MSSLGQTKKSWGILVLSIALSLVVFLISQLWLDGSSKTLLQILAALLAGFALHILVIMSTPRKKSAPMRSILLMKH
ncbi:MAG TPA: hypothetical protein VK206_24865, partial [Anaerolineales bacterium]|nr:hypothetical protein [Anaerolineales bacterium]